MNAAKSGTPLSRRESEVAQLVSDGLSNREIAQRLFISERTAEYHVESIRNKLGFHSRTQIAVWMTESRAAGTASAPAPRDRATGSPAPPTRPATVRRPAAIRWLGIAVAVGLLLVAALVALEFQPLPKPAAEAFPFAGTGVRGFAGDGGPAVAAELIRPTAIAVGGGGEVLLLAGDRVRQVGSDGVIKTIAGTGTTGFSGDGLAATLAQLNLHVFGGPIAGGVAVDPNGNVYVADRDNQRIRLISPSRTISTFAGTGTLGADGDDGPAAQAQLSSPAGLACDHSGNLFIADTGNNRVRMVDPSGVIRTVAGSGDPGYAGVGGPALQAQLNGPTGVAVDRADNLYIADSANNRVLKVGHAGIIETIAGTGQPGATGDGGPAVAARLSLPLAVATDDRGDIFVADTENNRVRRIDGAGTITTLAAGARLSHPFGVAVDRAGQVLVADTMNNRIILLLSRP